MRITDNGHEKWELKNFLLKKTFVLWHLIADVSLVSFTMSLKQKGQTDSIILTKSIEDSQLDSHQFLLWW